jgi:peptide/nickel transport system permease protein
MMISIILRRLLRLIPTLLGVVVVVFLMLHLAPGDPIELMMGEAGHISQQEIEALKRQYGLDLPISQQFIGFVTNALRGDLGVSFVHKRSVSELIKERLPATLELTSAALILAILVGIPIGIAAALKYHSLTDRAATGFVLVGISVPGFWLGILLILIFSMKLHWLPTSGRFGHEIQMNSITGLYLIDSLLSAKMSAFWEALRHLILPALTLAAPTIAVAARITRSSMLETLRQNYVVVARAKGLPEWKIVFKHAFKNAIPPIISLVGLEVGVLLSGNMIVETIFAWPGLGRLAVDGIYARDYPLVQGVVILYALTYVLVNMIVDISYAYFNPKVKL